MGIRIARREQGTFSLPMKDTEDTEGRHNSGHASISYNDGTLYRQRAPVPLRAETYSSSSSGKAEVRLNR